MSNLNPSSPETDGIDTCEEEFTVEDVVQMDIEDATMSEDAAVECEEASEAEAASDKDISAARIARKSAEAIPINPIPLKPIPYRPYPIKRNVSGRYENSGGAWKLELRVDVDGSRPMKRFSGDFFRVSGATVSYFGSFVVNTTTLSVTSTQVTVEGVADTTWPTSYKKIRVRIPHRSIFQSPGPAYVQWMTLSNNNGASYTCQYKSPYFRTVDLEQDSETGVTPFNSYNTGSLPSGGSARTLTVIKSYAEAGIEMRNAGVSNVVGTAPGGTWSNTELHAAMVQHFSLWKDVPQWKVWLFHAMAHEMGTGLLGIMFDQQGKQRQGCAAFYQSISGTSAVNLRKQLYVCVHELGHCFNLFHSFHKVYMNPPMPNRLSAKSWMNYPQNYPGGEAAFWSVFPFQFDNLEVVHLRHAFRNNIIMGGNPFGTGAALEDAFSDNISDDSGLGLRLEARKSFLLGEPVVAEIKLYTTDMRGKQVHKHLHPNFNFVQLAIQKPCGELVVHHPPIDHCIEVEKVELNESNPAIYESAYIGYDGEKGLIFSQPGVYKLRGAYYALDGSIVLSDVISIRIRNPLNEDDEKVADLFLGDEQGMLLYLLGSDSETLKSGNDAFEKVLEEHGEHSMAVYARLVKGFNSARPFKTIKPDYKIHVRKPDYDEAEKQLSAAVDASVEDAGLDNITLNMTMQRMANVQNSADKKKESRATMKRMVDIFEAKSLKSHVLSLIEEQAAEVTGKL